MTQDLLPDREIYLNTQSNQSCLFYPSVHCEELKKTKKSHEYIADIKMFTADIKMHPISKFTYLEMEFTILKHKEKSHEYIADIKMEPIMKFTYV